MGLLETDQHLDFENQDVATTLCLPAVGELWGAWTYPDENNIVEFMLVEVVGLDGTHIEFIQGDDTAVLQIVIEAFMETFSRFEVC